MRPHSFLPNCPTFVRELPQKMAKSSQADRLLIFENVGFRRKVWVVVPLRFRLPLKGEAVFFLAVAFFAARHQVSLGGLSAPDNRYQVIHS